MTSGRWCGAHKSAICRHMASLLCAMRPRSFVSVGVCSATAPRPRTQPRTFSCAPTTGLTLSTWIAHYTFDLDRPFGPWVRKVAANWCLNRLAAARPTQPLDEDDGRGPIGPASDHPEAVQVGRELEAEVRGALRALPDKHRAVVELRHFQDLSYSEIATALKLPVTDVRSYLFRARRLLAERLGHLRGEG